MQVLIWPCLLVLLSLAQACLVQTKNGQIQGFAENNLCKFLGVPYAQPPLGSLRWQPPQPLPSWQGALPATQYGSCCPGHGDVTSTDENCLFLNVFAPPTANKTPVMVWIHGGAFVGGCGSQLQFTGDFFSNTTNTILVTFNYRLGALGFLASRNAQLTGNYGIMDQMLVLQWVQANIEAFGGDPNQVTLFGESAGGLLILPINS